MRPLYCVGRTIGIAAEGDRALVRGPAHAHGIAGLVGDYDGEAGAAACREDKARRGAALVRQRAGAGAGPP